MRVASSLLSGVLLLAAAASCATQVTTNEGSGATGGDGGSITTGTGGAGEGGSGTGTGGSGPCSSADDCIAQSDTCNVGTCINGVCEKLPANDGTACDDGQFCTLNDLCQAGVCTGGTPKQCPPGGQCQVGACDEATDSCTTAPGNDGASCVDSDPCTLTGICSNGTCAPGQPVDCSFLNSECGVGFCDPQLGCVAMPLAEGAACDDGMFNPCTAGKCIQGTCTSLPANDDGPCTDNLFCTINDHCQGGTCVSGGPNPCAPPGGCYIASCNEATDSCTAVPGNDGASCDDFNACTTNTTCLAGACINGQPANEGMACDDGSGCTTGEFCTAGVCGGGAGPIVYFADDFKDNSKGWTLGNEWGIGPATASSGGVLGADPDTDHTASADDGVAGVVIGGNASTNLHPYYYLESPPFNTAAAAGPVILGFYRWLNSDYDPFMHNTIEVYNGSSWVTVWTSGGPPGIEDSPPNGMGWTFIQHDLTAYKNAGMRIRFGFDITSVGVFTIGSWNIDDVLVAGAACP